MTLEFEARFETGKEEAANVFIGFHPKTHKIPKIPTYQPKV